MNYDITIIVLTSMCGIGTVLGALLGAILAIQLIHSNGRKWHYVPIRGVKFRDYEPELRQYLEDGWDVVAIVASEIVMGTVDISIRKFM